MRLGVLLPVLLLLAVGCAPAAPSTPAAPPAAPPSGAAPQPSGGSTQAQTPPAPASLKVASGLGTYRAGLDIAIERGYFKAENIDVEIVPLQSGPDQVPFLASGQVDALFTGPAATHFNALAADVPVKFVAPCASSSPDAKVGNLLLVVRQDLYDSGQVRSVRDLAGRKIGIPNLESKAYVDAWAWFDRAGLRLTDATFVAPMTFPEMAVGLANKAIDAAITLEPFVTQSVAQGTAVFLLGDEQIMPLRLGCAVAFGEKLVKDRALGKRFLRAYLRGARDYNDAIFKNKDRAAIVQILVDKYPVKDPTMYDKMYPLYIDPNGKINTDSLEMDIRFYKQQGLLTAEPSIPKLVDQTLVNEVVAELGVYQ
jgi:NitT/TauT family transport system substrate-binding protein